ncbi:MAG: hypothetical protein AB7P03_14210 [Kofleriaceae bacterium]
MTRHALGIVAVVAACGDAPLDNKTDLVLGVAGTIDLELQASEPFSLAAHVGGTIELDRTDGDALTGVVALRLGENRRAHLTTITGYLEGHEVILNPATASVDDCCTVAWTSLRIMLVEPQGGGISDTGSGTIAGEWTDHHGDVIEMAAVAGTVAVTADVRPAQAKIAPLRTRWRPALFPGDPISIVLDEPIAMDSVIKLRLAANGEPIAGPSLNPTVVNGRVSSVTIAPSQLVPLGTTITLDTSAVRDVAGNPVTWDAAALQTPADPGTLTQNLSFENGLDGWFTAGAPPAASGDFLGLTPVDGANQATVFARGSLGGWFVVPSDANQLDLSVAVFSQVSVFDSRSAVVALVTADQQVVMYDAEMEAGASGPCPACDGAPYRDMIPPKRVTLDLTPLRGQTVYLVASSESADFPGLTEYAMVLDDIRIQ